MQKFAFFFKKIWSYQKKAVPLHPVLKTNQVFLAQLVEQLTLNQWVQGSSPWEDTQKKTSNLDVFFLCAIFIRFPDLKLILDPELIHLLNLNCRGTYHESRET